MLQHIARESGFHPVTLVQVGGWEGLVGCRGMEEQLHFDAEQLQLLRGAVLNASTGGMGLHLKQAGGEQVKQCWNKTLTLIFY